MRKLFTLALIVGVGLAAYLLGSSARSDNERVGRPQLVGHMVYFSLKDSSPRKKAELVAACKKYLSRHPGTVHFSSGVLAEDLKRDVNDRNFDVALQLVFENKAAHDRYQVAPDHERFIAENKGNWEKVRVFDAYVGQ